MRTESKGDPAVRFVALIGYRGTGKSTVARLLAERLGWAWRDADEEIELRAGTSIKEIFAAGGEEAFREWESTVVRDLGERDQTVLALGGGAVLRDKNRQVIRRGCVVWLTAGSATILDRIASDPTTSGRRPNLTAAGGIVEIEQLLAARAPYYRECADYVVGTDDKRPDQVADEIVCWLQSRFIPPSPDTRHADLS